VAWVANLSILHVGGLAFYLGGISSAGLAFATYMVFARYAPMHPETLHKNLETMIGKDALVKQYLG
jgi:membrane protein implicated in regulation of membrane protease activity